MNDGNVSAWDAIAKGLKNKMNMVALLDKASTPVFCVGAVSAFLVYFMRRQGIPNMWVGLIVGGLLLVCVVWGWFRVRHSMFRDQDARAFLDEQLGLHGALSASRERAVFLPVPMDADCSYKWSSYKSFYWILGGMAMLCLGALLPVVKSAEDEVPYVTVPPQVSKVEEWVSQLEENEDVDTESIEPFRQQLDDFYKKGNEELYTHSSLEAADALKTHMETAMMDFAKGVDDVASALSQMQSEMNQGKDANATDLTAALEAMEGQALQPGGQLAQDLANIDPAGIKELSNEQMQQLMERMKDAANCMNGMCNGGMVLDPDKFGIGRQGPGNGQEGNGEGNEPGPGGIARGRGDAPLHFGPESDRIAGAQEKVESDNMEHARLGDQVGIQHGQHEVDPSKRHELESGGAANTPALGGDAVWTDHITPREREALRKVFE